MNDPLEFPLCPRNQKGEAKYEIRQGNPQSTRNPEHI